jgi:hypothetical protein
VENIGYGLGIGTVITLMLMFFVRLDFRRHGKKVYKDLGLLPEKPEQKKPDREQVRREKIKIAKEVRAFRKEAREENERREILYEKFVPPADWYE